MADTLAINGTTVGLEAVSAPSGGYGSVLVVALDWGVPDVVQFLDPRPLGDGKVFRGQVSQDRKFTLGLAGYGAGSLAKGQDTWQAVLELLRNTAGAVSYKYTRTDGTGGSVVRELLAIVDGDLPAWQLVDKPGEPGMRPNGNWLMTLSCRALHPWFRNFTETTTTISPSGTTPANSAITRSGTRPCGLQVKVSTAGTLGSITISDGSRSMVLTATFNATPKGIDWYYSDPGATSIDSGVTIGIPSHLSMHSATTTITATPGIGSSGNHTVTVKHKPVWETP